MANAPVKDLCAYLDASPTPYHAVAETVRRLEKAGYAALEEAAEWKLEAGDRRFVVRHGSLLAFEVGNAPLADAGFRAIGAHTDSPNLRLKPNAEVESSGYRQLAIEPYGGLLLHTWLDRDLSLAGRVSVLLKGRVETVLVDLERPLLRVAELAIHLQREVREQGLKLNAQTQMTPIFGLATGVKLSELLIAAIEKSAGLRVEERDIAGHELMAYDTARAEIGGAGGEFIFSARLDNLASCHAAMTALADAQAPSESTRVVVLYDHEEVGSRSASGAASPFLADAFARIAAATGGGTQTLPRALSRSLLVSADMAHAVHPNFADRHEPGHRPVIGGGPVIKTNVNLSYASDAPATAAFVACCRKVGLEPQRFVARSDMPCGSTIGPITATRVGIATVDVGNPMLSMHSCREMAGTADVTPMIAALGAFLAS